MSLILLPSFLWTLFGFFLATSISAAEILWGLIVLVWLIEIFTKKKSFVFSRVDILICVFVFWNALSGLHAGSVELQTAIAIQLPFLLFFMFSRYLNIDQIKKVLMGLCLGAAFSGLLALVQSGSGLNFIPTPKIYEGNETLLKLPHFLMRYIAARDGRAVGTRSHPLTFAETLIFPFFLMLWIIFSRHQWKEIFNKTNLKYFVVFGLISIGLLLSKSRGVWLSVGVGLLLISVLPHRFKAIRNICLTTLFIVPLVLMISPSMRSRIMSVFSPEKSSYADQYSRQIRFKLWEESYHKMNANPLLGVGLKGLEIWYPEMPGSPDKNWTESHNIYLQIGAELGWVGLILFLLILIFIPVEMFRHSQIRRGLKLYIFLSVYICFLLSGITETWIRDKEIALIFWMMAGIMLNTEFLKYEKEN